jgi:predicted GH43/DUF377 family glycosyl hydrolase
MQLTRHPHNPLLTPDLASDWQCYNVFNAGVIHHNDLFHVFYRAQGLDWISRIGYAVSADGVHFNRLAQPVLAPQDDWDCRGVEDPRITWLADENRFIMAYTAYSHLGITPMFAESHNLISWRRLGPLVKGEDNKDHALFPRKVNGCYLTFHRRPPSIWIAWSNDLLHWVDMREILKPRPGGWDCSKVGAAGLPIETGAGWLVIYHATDTHNVYRLGVCLLDKNDPSRVIARPGEFIFEPRELWELKGDVPNVVFSCANPVVDGTVYVYYGGADHVIGLATCQVDELLNYTLTG